MKDTDPQVIAIHLSLGDQVMRLDQLETRTFQHRNGGLYVAPELPSSCAESTAGNVVLTLAYIALGRSS